MKTAPLLFLALLSLCCATKAPPKMGTISDLSRVEGPAIFCDHNVPEQVCTRHHPELISRFKAVNDWCPEHDVPESQCFACHPDLTFEALPKLREGADLSVLVKNGEAVGDLSQHAVPGKVTLFDFYADWCAGCREIDLHAYKLLNAREDVAVRKINVVDWDTAVAREHLTDVKGLPYVVVFGRDGQLVGNIQGVDLAAIDEAIAQGTSR